MTNEKQYHSVKEFWPFYLRQHASRGCRVLHYIGTTLVFVFLASALYMQNYWLLLCMPVAGYFFAWVGHFGIEHNKPATFQYPLYSLVCDFMMYFRFLSGTLKQPLQDAGVLPPAKL
ncbi:MAG: DUF962 domain-containing protein [Leptospiraceae bacterium]|nr:DUF962 domain-containing protein [Leptospiraceae bacterium]